MTQNHLSSWRASKREGREATEEHKDPRSKRFGLKEKAGNNPESGRPLSRSLLCSFKNFDDIVLLKGEKQKKNLSYLESLSSGIPPI